MILLVNWEYEGKKYSETQEHSSQPSAYVKFHKKNAGKLLSIKKTKRKLGYYKEFR